MMTINNKTVVPFKGDYKPVSIYKNGEEIFTPTPNTQTGTELTFENTYNDECELIKVYGDIYQNTENISTSSPSEIIGVNGTLTSYLNDSNSSSISIPDIYALKDNNGNIIAQDILYINRVSKTSWIEHSIGTAILDGSESWFLSGTVDSSIKQMSTWVISELINPPENNNIISNIISNMYVTSSGNANYTLENYGLSVVSDGKLSILDSTFNTSESISDFREFLSENPLTVFYELKEKVIEEIPYQNLKTYKETTNIVFQDNCEFSTPNFLITVITYK